MKYLIKQIYTYLINKSERYYVSDLEVSYTMSDKNDEAKIIFGDYITYFNIQDYLRLKSNKKYGKQSNILGRDNVLIWMRNTSYYAKNENVY